MDFRNILLTFAPETMLTTPALKNNIPCPDACQRPQKPSFKNMATNFFVIFYPFALVILF